MTKTEGRLDQSLCYLSGPMEFVADHGVEWRRNFIKLSDEAGLRIDYIDPTNKPGDETAKIGENKDHQNRLKAEGRYVELQEYVDSYRRQDLRYTDLADFLVAVVDPRVPQWGTSNEIYVAEWAHKPMFFICDGGLKNLPNWLFGVIEIKGRCNVFESVEEVIEELKRYNSGEVPINDKWVLIRSYVEQHRRYRV